MLIQVKYSSSIPYICVYIYIHIYKWRHCIQCCNTNYYIYVYVLIRDQFPEIKATRVQRYQYFKICVIKLSCSQLQKRKLSPGKCKVVHFYTSLKTTDKNLVIFKDFYLFIYRERERGGEREGAIYQCVVASQHPILGAWPATQACAMTGNRTGDPLVLSPCSILHQSGQRPCYIHIYFYTFYSWK